MRKTAIIAGALCAAAFGCLGAGVPDATPKVEYKFNYKLDDKGNAILCGEPCVSPKPEGVLVIPDKIDGHTVTKIDNVAFKGCDKMTKIVLPPHLEEIVHKSHTMLCPGQIFQGCFALEAIEISKANPKYTSENGILYSKDKKYLIAYPKTRSQIMLARETTDVGWNAFESCTFKAVRIPDSIESIGFWAFCRCPCLEIVEFPKSIKWVGTYAFDQCPNMKKVVFNGDAPGTPKNKATRYTLGRENLFRGSSEDIVVEVKKGSKGWNWKAEGSTELPARWPPKRASRPIRYGQSDVQLPEQPLPEQPRACVQNKADAPGNMPEEALEGLKKRLAENLAKLKELQDKNPACYINPRVTSIINVDTKIATMKDRRYCSCNKVKFVRDAFYCSGCKRITGYRGDRTCDYDYGYGFCKVCRQQGFYRWLNERKQVETTAKINAQIDELNKENEALKEHIHDVEQSRRKR